MRISAVTYENPELTNHEGFTRLVRLLTGGEQVEAAMLLADLVGSDDDALRHLDLGDLAPVLPELAALNALLDENPLDDQVGWDILRGDKPTVDPTMGISLDWLSEVTDPGPGHAAETMTPQRIRDQIGDRVRIDGYLRNIGALQDGRILVQTVRGPDGVERYVVQLPGMQQGTDPTLESPQDLSGAIRNAQLPDSAYTKAVQQAMWQAGVPESTEVMLVGYSAGGVAAMNLAQDPGFNGGRYRVTDVVTVGAPVDQKTIPSGSGSEVVTVTNDRDIVPVLDGRGPGSPEPVVAGRTEIRVSSPGIDFRQSHGLDVYDNLLGAADDSHYSAIDERTAEYGQGTVVESTTYLLSDHPPTERGGGCIPSPDGSTAETKARH
jgi:pimeloyl-ACP methyl ester carboxylesterase